MITALGFSRFIWQHIEFSGCRCAKHAEDGATPFPDPSITMSGTKSQTEERFVKADPQR